jgi:hypothetical protein
MRASRRLTPLRSSFSRSLKAMCSRPAGQDNLYMALVAFLGTYGPPDDPQRMTGTDVGVTKDGKLTALYVFIDPPSQK